jgi:hypothetical protein
MLRETETYTATNFLRLQTTGDDQTTGSATLEHFMHRQAADAGETDWCCVTIIDAEPMSRSDALFIAESYARENDIPVIYTSHSGTAAPAS